MGNIGYNKEAGSFEEMAEQETPVTEAPVQDPGKNPPVETTEATE